MGDALIFLVMLFNAYVAYDLLKLQQLKKNAGQKTPWPLPVLGVLNVAAALFNAGILLGLPDF